MSEWILQSIFTCQCKLAQCYLYNCFCWSWLSQSLAPSKQRSGKSPLEQEETLSRTRGFWGMGKGGGEGRRGEQITNNTNVLNVGYFHSRRFCIYPPCCRSPWAQQKDWICSIVSEIKEPTVAYWATSSRILVRMWATKLSGADATRVAWVPNSL